MLPPDLQALAVEAVAGSEPATLQFATVFAAYRANQLDADAAGHVTAAVAALLLAERVTGEPATLYQLLVLLSGGRAVSIDLLNAITARYIRDAARTAIN